MKKLTTLLIVCFVFVSATTLRGQVVENVLENTLVKPNIIKFNLTGPVVGYYTIGYERVINPKQSTGITISIAPNVDLPFKSTLLDLFGDNDEAVTAINSTTFTNFSLMPEYRFYVGVKGAPFGFYAASFLKYTHMTHSQIYQFTSDAGVVHKPLIETTFNGFGAGELIGIQWQLGKSMTLDWWILGPFVGVLNGKSHGIDDMSDMSAQDKADMEADIEAVPIPGWTIEATVAENTVDVDLGGLFFGTRIFGLNLGVRF